MSHQTALAIERPAIDPTEDDCELKSGDEVEGPIQDQSPAPRRESLIRGRREDYTPLNDPNVVFQLNP